MCYGASDCSVASEWMVDHNYGEAGEMTSVKGDGRHLSAKALCVPTQSYRFTNCCQAAKYGISLPISQSTAN